MHTLRYALIAASLWLALVAASPAVTPNGNDFALSVKEAKTPAARKAILDAAQGQPHFFRYLQIMEMEPVTEEGHDGFKIVAFEPGSYYDVKFTVLMSNSLALLKAPPASKVGDAIAVTGQVAGLEPGKNVILLESPIVKLKDRKSPKIGQELLGEVNPGATFYSYTEGPRPVNLEYRDRDLLVNRDKVLAAGGPKAWAEFLEKEIAKRKQQRAAEAAAGGAAK